MKKLLFIPFYFISSSLVCMDARQAGPANPPAEKPIPSLVNLSTIVVAEQLLHDTCLDEFKNQGTIQKKDPENLPPVAAECISRQLNRIAPSILYGTIKEELYGYNIKSATFNRTGNQIALALSNNIAQVFTFNEKSYRWELEATLRGHDSTVFSAVFNKTGNRIATSSYDGTAKIWERENDQWVCKGTLSGHRKWVKGASFQDDDVVTTCLHDNTRGDVIKYWSKKEGDANWLYRNSTTSPCYDRHDWPNTQASLLHKIGDKCIDDANYRYSPPSSVTVRFPGWRVDKADLSQTMLFFLAEHEYNCDRVLILSDHEHLRPIWKKLPDATKKYLIANYHVDPSSPIVHLPQAPQAHWSTTTQVVAAAALTACAFLGLKRFLK